MKIPETSANVGAYYGTEENGQWQPNGVIMDSGVGGGVVGSGDAGFVHHAPMYPVPRPHMPTPGYVMAGAYYSPGAAPYVPPAAPDDFADYMWMENEEEFDKQVMQQLEEEALMEQCIEAMLEDEQREQRHRPTNGHTHYPTTSNGASGISLQQAVSRSTLNPLAAEFIPTRHNRTIVTEEKEKPVEVSATQEVEKAQSTECPSEPVIETKAETATEVKAETEESQHLSDTPEVSAADVQPISEKAQEKRPKEQKKDTKAKTDVKKPAKVDIKKTKPQVVKSEPKVSVKKEVKKEVKPVKSEVKSDIKVEEPEPAESIPAPEPVKVVATPVEDPVPAGPKPINYAAAAKANKPKAKATSPPALDKPSPPPSAKPDRPAPNKTTDKTEKHTKPADKSISNIKDKCKSDKPAVKVNDKPRKNSTK